MYVNFEKLPQEKKDKILNAAINEFCKESYSSASTNNIINEAGISKGALFNYFGSKKNLYLYLVDYLKDYYVKYMINKMKINSTDIFQRIIDWEELKASIAFENPSIRNFFAYAFVNVPEKLKVEIGIRYKKLHELGYKLTTEGIDLSKFRDDIDKVKAVELIVMTLDGLTQKRVAAYKSMEGSGYDPKDIDRANEEFKDYIVVLRKVFYK